MKCLRPTLALFTALLFAPLAALNADDTPVPASRANHPSIDRIWLGHRSHDPGKLVVNWMTKEPGDSVVRFGRTANYGQEVRVANNTTIHHVEIPLEESGGVYHYSVHTGNQSSADAVFKAYPTDELRVAIAADWQRLPDLSAIKNIAITGFGYYAERAEVDGFTYYNTSLSGKGNQYPDPKSAFLKGADSYILLTLTKNPSKMVVEIKGLDGTVLDRKVYP